MVGAAPRVCTWYIRQVDLFRHLAEREADGLAHALSVRSYPRGRLIVDSNTQPELVCVMRAGTVRLFHPERDGRQTTVDRLGSGELFGVTGLLVTDASGLLAEAETDVDVGVVEHEAHHAVGVPVEGDAGVALFPGPDAVIEHPSRKKAKGRG